MTVTRWRFAALTWALLLTLVGNADGATREEALAIAKQYAEHSWEATERNVLHGTDKSGISVRTPNRAPGDGRDGLWVAGQANVGMPYKWGGFDSLQSFEAGIRAGKAAGDLYNLEKRKKGGAAVSAAAVGIDCSGFISRCWQLRKKESTHTLPSLCRALASPAELRPADIMNTRGGHVLLFAEWLDREKTRALFYEAEPFSKVISSERQIDEMIAAGYQPLRFRRFAD
jgi:hypothetical protein